MRAEGLYGTDTKYDARKILRRKPEFRATTLFSVNSPAFLRIVHSLARALSFVHSLSLSLSLSSRIESYRGTCGSLESHRRSIAVCVYQSAIRSLDRYRYGMAIPRLRSRVEKEGFLTILIFFLLFISR